MYVCVYTYMYISFYLPIYLSIYLSIYLPVSKYGNWESLGNQTIYCCYFSLLILHYSDSFEGQNGFD